MMVTAVPFDRDAESWTRCFASLLRLTVEEQDRARARPEKSVAVVPVRYSPLT
ncbi:MAG: hypothetical protein ACLR4Z_08550 [Butyricicoccaceae bacterium]